MAGYIFSVAKSLMNEVKEENIKKGYFTPYTPAITEEYMSVEKERSRKALEKVLVATFAELFSHAVKYIHILSRKITVIFQMNITVSCIFI